MARVLAHDLSTIEHLQLLLTGLPVLVRRELAKSPELRERDWCRPEPYPKLTFTGRELPLGSTGRQCLLMIGEDVARHLAEAGRVIDDATRDQVTRVALGDIWDNLTARKRSKQDQKDALMGYGPPPDMLDANDLMASVEMQIAR